MLRVLKCPINGSVAQWSRIRAIHGFTVQELRQVPELQLSATLLRHDKTGLEHLHVKRDDPNNVFSIGFATPPSDSTGVPHILEHVTLCGSEKYPVRDPFFKMLNRSLATYMNAFTASDYTFYPFATVNAADHANLRDVYLDATLFPRLRKIDFLQEGWRLEHKDPQDITSPIEFKGVVYNEMKGQMSDASYFFYIMFQRELFSGTTYGHDSGGDPKHILDLTHEALLAFHQQHYHPSNSKVFTYGSFPLDEQLQSLNAKLMSFSANSPASCTKNVKPWQKLRTVEALGPLDPLTPADAQIKSSLSFLCNDVADTAETFSLKVLSNLLLDGHGAPLYKGLIEEGLGTDFSPNTGYDASTKSAVFSVGAQGVKETNLPLLKERIQQILQKVAVDGFGPTKIDGLLHQMEIAMKRRNANFGMNLLNSVASGWFNGVDPLDMLSWNETIDRFKERMASGDHLQSLIKKYLLLGDKTSALHFTMRPLATYNEGVSLAESQALQSRVEALSSAEAEVVQQEGLRLLEYQNAEEDTACLPTLKVTDIAPTGRYIEVKQGKAISKVPVSWNFQGSGLTYLRILTTFPELPPNLQPYVPLFTDSFSNLGTKWQSMAEIEDKLKLNTGGVSFSSKISTDPADTTKYEFALVLSSCCVDSKIPSMFQLIKKILLETNFENTEKLKHLVRMNASGVISNIAEAGHSFARSFAASSLTPSGRLAETQSGMTQVKLMTELALQDDLSDVVDKLKQIAHLAFRRESLRCFVTADPEQAMVVEEELQNFFAELDAGELASNNTEVFEVSTPRQTFFPLPYSVNYAALSVRGVPYRHPDGPALQILASLLTNKFLHREIREKGGAYGGGATFSATSGVFSFYSYRDPNITRTLQTMMSAGPWAAKQAWTVQEIDEAKLSLFQGIDAPSSLSSEGMIEFADRITPKMQQERRERLLDVDCEKVQATAQQYLVDAIERKDYSIAVLGQNAESLDLSHGWTVLDWSLGTESPEKSDAELELDAGTSSTADSVSNTATIVDKHGQIVKNARRGSDGELLTVQVTDRACAQLVKVRNRPDQTSATALRLALESGGCHGYQYVISLTNEIDEEEDVIFEKLGATIVVDQETLALIDGSKVDYTMELIGSEFKILDNPRAVSKCGCDISIDIDIGAQARATS